MAIGPGGTMLELFTALWKDETGQDLAEYALLLAFIAIAVVLTLPLLGSAIDTIFDNIRGELEAAPGGSGGS
jgi:Flp pilus assembly pilin Flp